MTPPFRPAWWARGPHAQTLLARAFRPDAGPDVERERIETVDGDFFDVDWSRGGSPPSAAPVVVVLHGLEGMSTRKYVRSVCREIVARGARTVAMNFRGCSGEPNRSLSFYHSGDTRDLDHLVRIVRERYPEAAVGGMGFSLGGNVLLKAMGERDDGGTGLFDAAAAMSVPYDLAAGAELLQRSRMGRVYTEYFLRSLRGKLEAKRERLGAVLDLEAAAAVDSIQDFDERVTAPLNGFASAADYYARCSSRPFLPGIRVPTLLLHAEDDPFLPSTAIPRTEASRNGHLTLALSRHGGHVGFLAGTPARPRFWGDVAAADFLVRTLEGS